MENLENQVHLDNREQQDNQVFKERKDQQVNQVLRELQASQDQQEQVVQRVLQEELVVEMQTLVLEQ